MENNEHRRLSVISYLIIFLCIVMITILLFEKLEVNAYSALDESSNNISANAVNNDSVTEENKTYIGNIKAEYGINILYGTDVENFAYKVDAVSQYDKNIVNNNLKMLYSALKKYPKSLFSIFKSKDYPLYIMLVDKFNNDNLALASRNNLNVFRIYISNADNFERAFHHEMYHILEYYIADKNKTVFSSWGNLNPINFKYDKNLSKLDMSYVFVDNKNTNGYFVTRYSKATEKEDRAEIFAELMIAKSRPNFLQSNNIYSKSMFIKKSLLQNISEQSFEFYKFM